ncbi:MAG: TolC family protein [Bacteroidetes bacterium]|nr:TolC family protein [Bacteroidota bacterium]
MRRFISGLLFLSALQIQAQGTAWTLENCIKQAVTHNLDIATSAVIQQQNKNLYQQSKFNKYPDLSFGAGQFVQSGRSLDRYTNQFVQTAIPSNNFQLSTSVTLFAGGQIRNNISQNKYLWLASEADMRNAEMNISLSVANFFLQVVQAKELVKSATETLNSTKAQLERAEKQYAAGAINEGGVLNLKAQKAGDEATLINAKNQEMNALSQLKMVMRVPQEQNFDVVVSEIGVVPAEDYPADMLTLYDSALKRRPDVESSELRTRAAEYRLKVAKGSMLPVLSLGGNLSTVYSGNAKMATGYNFLGWDTTGRVMGTSQWVEAPIWKVNTKTIAFSKQIQDNFGQSFGLNLNVPVWNKFNARTTKMNAGLELERARLNVERSKQTVYNEVVTAWNNFQSALKRYEANKSAHEAQKMNLDFVQKRYDAGQSSVFELQISRSAEAAARLNLVSVRYEYLFRRLVLDFYRGLDLKLD